jgi:AbrB family looped-hinge helix DNA binding protein
MSSRSKISKGFLTVVPKEVRMKVGLREGDAIEWSVDGESIRVLAHRKVGIDDIVALASHGGDAVVSKKEIQAGKIDRR